MADQTREHQESAPVERRAAALEAALEDMVLPVQPPATLGWPEAKLVDVVTKDSMIGVSRL